MDPISWPSDPIRFIEFHTATDCAIIRMKIDYLLHQILTRVAIYWTLTRCNHKLFRIDIKKTKSSRTVWFHRMQTKSLINLFTKSIGRRKNCIDDILNQRQSISVHGERTGRIVVKWWNYLISTRYKQESHFLHATSRFFRYLKFVVFNWSVHKF